MQQLHNATIDHVEILILPVIEFLTKIYFLTIYDNVIISSNDFSHNIILTVIKLIEFNSLICYKDILYKKPNTYLLITNNYFASL